MTRATTVTCDRCGVTIANDDPEKKAWGTMGLYAPSWSIYADLCDPCTRIMAGYLYPARP